MRLWPQLEEILRAYLIEREREEVAYRVEDHREVLGKRLGALEAPGGS